MAKEESIRTGGVIIKHYGYGKFQVKLENGCITTCYPCGRMKRRGSGIKLVPGDEVIVELSPYEPDRGRIVWRK